MHDGEKKKRRSRETFFTLYTNTLKNPPAETERRGPF
jgi:hypothetical protein